MRNFLIIFWLSLSVLAANAQQSGIVRILPTGTALVSDNYTITLTLSLSRAVPYRVFTLNAPRRLVIDLPDVDFTFMPQNLPQNVAQVSGLRFGNFAHKQSRLVLDLEEPFTLNTANIDETLLTVRLSRSSDADFAEQSGPPAEGLLPQSPRNPVIEGKAGLPLVALDAGHGGVDPGAVRGGITEKQVTLAFARQLRDALIATGRYRVLMTREDDTFLELPERIRLAQASGADIFLSLHANTVERGNARGTSVYTLSKEASDNEAASRAEMENRSDVIAGAVLLGQDDALAQVLLEMAQRETNAKSNLFADILSNTIRGALDSGAPSRRLSANFRVLRAVDTPSVLVELGFLSNTTDLANLMSAYWRVDANFAIISALDEWLIFSQ